MRKLDWPTIGILCLWIVVGIWMLIYSKAEAQDNPISVCRRAGYYNPIRLEFHNIPANWFVWNDATAPSWGYWAEGVAMDNGVLEADALMVDTDGYSAGTAVLVDYTDNWTLVGDENTPLCDAPIETPATPTPEPVPPVVQRVVSQAVVSSGRTCVVKYLESNNVVLVCNG